jgi:hypothetical protein
MSGQQLFPTPSDFREADKAEVDREDLIEEYKKIKRKESRLSARERESIVWKVDLWLKKGAIKQEELTQ